MTGDSICPGFEKTLAATLGFGLHLPGRNHLTIKQRPETMKTLLRIAVLASTMFVWTPFIQAGDDQPADAPKPAKKAKGMPLNGKVSAVDKTAKTVTIGETEKARVLQITSETRIYKNNKPGTFDDIVVGEHIGAYVRPNADGKMEIVTLKTGLATPKTKPEEKKLDK